MQSCDATTSVGFLNKCNKKTPKMQICNKGTTEDRAEWILHLCLPVYHYPGQERTHFQHPGPFPGAQPVPVLTLVLCRPPGQACREHPYPLSCSPFPWQGREHQSHFAGKECSWSSGESHTQSTTRNNTALPPPREALGTFLAKDQRRVVLLARPG